MQFNRPIVLSIAGFDPSGGAGVLSDIKTFELHKVYGLGVNTAQTIQTEKKFFSVKWEQVGDIIDSLKQIFAHYNVAVIKIGLVENVNMLERLVSFIHSINLGIKIIIDPIASASAGFAFWNEKMPKEILQKIFLLTPNYDEITRLSGNEDAKKGAAELSEYCNILLKGGHNTNEPGTDYLFTKDNIESILPVSKLVYPKHGSGCVLSASVTANLALGYDLPAACANAKRYVEKFLSGNRSLLGYHYA